MMIGRMKTGNIAKYLSIRLPTFIRVLLVRLYVERCCNTHGCRLDVQSIYQSHTKASAERRVWLDTHGSHEPRSEAGIEPRVGFDIYSGDQPRSEPGNEPRLWLGN